MADMYLYILCEGELDEMFYEHVAERVTVKTFESPKDFRLRRGANWKTAISGARLLINRVRHWADSQPVGIIIAVDNDRAPGHPGGQSYLRPLSASDQRKEPRYTGLVQMLQSALGTSRAAWPVKVALAVPVEMIESWVLTLIDPSRAASLPVFSQASQPSAHFYYGAKPPLQLKDMRDEEAKSLGLSRDEYFWQASEQDFESAANASPSFKMFLDDLKTW